MEAIKLNIKGFEGAAFFVKEIIEDGSANPVRMLGIRMPGYETEWILPSKITSMATRLINMGATGVSCNLIDNLETVRDKLAETVREKPEYIIREHRCIGWRNKYGKQVYFGAQSVGLPIGVSNFDNTGIGANLALRKCGTLDGWIDAVRTYIFGKRINEVIIAASFAGILRELYPNEDFANQGLVLNIFGESGNGKTTLIRAAHSIFSCPSGYQKYHSTHNALISTIAARGPMVSAVDDVCRSQKKNMLDLIFNLASGTGKNRCQNNGNTRQLQRFYGTIITSNVTPVMGMTGDNVGQLRRLIEVGIDDEHIIAKNATEAEAMSRAFDQNYGYACEKFAQSLLEEYNLCKISSMYKSFQSIAEGKVANGLQNSIALILTCAAICNKAFFGNKGFNTEDMLKYLISVCNDAEAQFISPAAEIKLNKISETLQAYILDNKHYFHKGRYIANEDRSKWLGIYLNGKRGETTIYIQDSGESEGTFDAMLAGFMPDDIIGQEQKPNVDSRSFTAAIRELRDNKHVLLTRARGNKKNIIMEKDGVQEPVYALFFGTSFKIP